MTDTDSFFESLRKDGNISPLETEQTCVPRRAHGLCALRAADDSRRRSYGHYRAYSARALSSRIRFATRDGTCPDLRSVESAVSSEAVSACP